MQDSKKEKIMLIKDIIKGNVDPYLLNLGIAKSLNETIKVNEKCGKHFIEGIEVDINKISCNLAIMPDTLII